MIENEKENNVSLNTEIKRWIIIDALTNRIIDMTDQQFSEGIENNYIKLRGQFIKIGNNDKIWIDGILKR